MGIGYTDLIDYLQVLPSISANFTDTGSDIHQTDTDYTIWIYIKPIPIPIPIMGIGYTNLVDYRSIPSNEGPTNANKMLFQVPNRSKVQEFLYRQDIYKLQY